MKPPCRIDDCRTESYSRDLCELHYRRLLRHGDVRADTPRRGTGDPPPCSVPGCEKPVDARGWCHGHHQRWLRHGDVRADEPLSRRKQAHVCRVDACGRETNAQGYCRTHSNHVRKYGDPKPESPVSTYSGQGWFSHGYFCVPVPPELRSLTNGEAECAEHRLIMAMHLGRALHPDETVHHRNGHRTDSRLENLDLWSSRHPKGQRAEDKVAFAIEILQRYRPDALSAEG